MDRKFLLIIILSVVLFSANLSGISIYILDEAKNSTAAREMLEGNHIVPTFNYELRTDKPPLHYYFMMLGYSWFGVNEFGARFFSAFFGIALVLVTFLFTRRFMNKETAFWSALVLLSSIQVIIQFHMAVPDPYLIFFFALTLFFAYAFYVEGKNFWIYLAYVSISLAVLSKGPVALLLAGATWLMFLLCRKDLSFKTLASFRIPEGLLIMILLIVPWYLAVHIQTGGAWTTGFFLKHNMERFTAPMEGHGGSFLLIPLYVIIGLFPFSLFIIQATRNFWKNKQDGFLTLAAITSGVIILFFSVSSTKLPSYPAPSFPFVAVLIGFFLSEKVKSFQKNILWTYGVYFIIALAIPVTVYIVLEDVLILPEIKNMAYWFILLPIGAVVAISFFLRKYPKQAFLSISASWMITTVCFFYIVFPSIDKRNPVSRAMPVIKSTDTIYYYEKYNPAFSFYIHKKIHLLTEEVITTNKNKSTVVLSMQRDLSGLAPLQANYQIIQTHREFFEPYFSSVLYENADKISSNETRETNP